MLATVAEMGEAAAFEWWAKMRANGVKVSKGWTESYYTEFSHNGGKRPLVVSYATSPAAEVFFSKVKITSAPTGVLFLRGGVFHQVEGIALVAGGKQVVAANKFIDFLRSAAVQEALQTSMWMFPIEAKTPRVDAMRYAMEPANPLEFALPTAQEIAAQGSQWVSRWIKVMR
jgi:thiamine transport system substrate-binding protein